MALTSITYSIHACTLPVIIANNRLVGYSLGKKLITVAHKKSPSTGGLPVRKAAWEKFAHFSQPLLRGIVSFDVIPRKEQASSEDFKSNCLGYIGVMYHLLVWWCAEVTNARLNLLLPRVPLFRLSLDGRGRHDPTAIVGTRGEDMYLLELADRCLSWASS